MTIQIPTSSRRHSGFSLIELIISIFIIGTILTLAFNIYALSLKQIAKTQERTAIENQLQTKIESIKHIGFWVWSGQTNQPNNPLVMTEWEAELRAANITGTATMSSIFMKDDNGDLIPFTSEFDGNTDRNQVQITLSITTSSQTALQQSTLLTSLPNAQSLYGQVFILKKAIDAYVQDTGHYPNPATWTTDLVPAYLSEIPNDPYTSLQPKTTHTEESIDWFYTQTPTQVQLAPQSHRTTHLVRWTLP